MTVYGLLDSILIVALAIVGTVVIGYVVQQRATGRHRRNPLYDMLNIPFLISSAIFLGVSARFAADVLAQALPRFLVSPLVVSAWLLAVAWLYTWAAGHRSRWKN